MISWVASGEQASDLVTLWSENRVTFFFWGFPAMGRPHRAHCSLRACGWESTAHISTPTPAAHLAAAAHGHHCIAGDKQLSIAWVAGCLEREWGLNQQIREGFLEEEGAPLCLWRTRDSNWQLTAHRQGRPTWKTLIRAWGKLSKLLRRTSVSSKSYRPPKSCMPSRAKMTMKRKSSSSSEAMERMELSREATRLLNDVQYLAGAG